MTTTADRTTETRPTDPDPADPPGTETLRVALLIGSVRSGRFADTLLPWVERHLAGLAWLDLDVVDLATTPLSPAMDAASPVSERLDRADAFVMLTPEYNHGYPAALKLAIDSHRDEWARKPVTFVAYGAGSGGVRAVEQLRTVLAELHATTTRNAVHVASPWDHLDADGRFDPPAQLDDALAATLADLRWWAATLRAGRRTRPVAS